MGLNRAEKQAFGLRMAGDALLRAGYPERGLPLIRQACEMADHRENWQALYDAGLAGLDFDIMTEAVAGLERCCGGTADGAAHLAYLRSGPLRMNALLDRLDSPASAPQSGAISGRVLYVLHKSLPFATDGYALRSHGIARAIAQAGGDMICVTRPGFPADLPHHPEPGTPETETALPVDGITYHRIAQPRRDAFPPSPQEHLAHASADYLERAAEPILREIARHRAAQVIAASNHTTALPAALAARAAGVPFTLEVRGFWDVTHISRDPAYAGTPMHRMEVHIETRLARAADRVITLNPPMRTELIKRGVPAERIHLLPNAVDPTPFAQQPRDMTLAAELGLPTGVPVIGYIGSFSVYEGLDDLILACAGLKQAGHGFHLLLVGSEATTSRGTRPVTDRLHDLIRTHGLEHHVTLPGRLDPARIPACYSLIDIAPIPRKSLPVTELVPPLKPLEAMAAGVPVVLSTVAALKDMARQGDTALTCAPDDPRALQHSLAQLLGDRDLRMRIGRAGRDWVHRTRSWEKIAMQLQTILHEGG